MNEPMMWTAVAAALLGSDLVLLWLGYALFARGQPQPALPDAAQLRADFDALRNAMQGLDGCLATMDRAVRSAALTPVATPDAEPGVRQRTYRIAHRLAEKGAPVVDLMGDCGLTRGEAELIRNLHGRKPPGRGDGDVR